MNERATNKTNMSTEKLEHFTRLRKLFSFEKISNDVRKLRNFNETK